MMKKSTRQLVLSALFAALVCVVTMLIKVPSPFKGYFNLGDCMVLLSGWLLSPLYGFFAAGIGSALADVFSGFAVYAPVTFVIKGLTALTAFALYKTLEKKTKDIPGRIISGLSGEAVMVIGYYIFEGFMYGFAASSVNILPNILQAAAGLISGIVLIKVFQKTKISI